MSSTVFGMEDMKDAAAVAATSGTVHRVGDGIKPADVYLEIRHNTLTTPEIFQQKSKRNT